jgi:sulfate transport system substrate-binding protein
MVTPRSTILIENPIAVVDKYVDKHGNRAADEAFVTFLLSAEAQNVFAEYGLRSIDPSVAAAHADAYRPVEDQWTIDYLGGWKAVTPQLFGEDGVYTRAIAEVQQ